MTVKNADCTRVHPLAQSQLLCELLAFILCVLITAIQLGLIDFYFVYHSHNRFWLIWIAADCVVLGIMGWLLHTAISYSRRCLRKSCLDEDDENINYAFVVWLVYALLLSAKIATFFPEFSVKLIQKQAKNSTNFQFIADDAIEWGPIRLKFILGLSAIIFLLLVLSHHYNRVNSLRATYLSSLSSSISIDLLDSVLFLEFLTDQSTSVKLEENSILKVSILVFACLNFILPTFSLFKLRYQQGLPAWVPLPYEKLYALVYLMFVNVPFLIIRLYLWRQVHKDVSIFFVKNMIMIALGIRDLWMSFLLWKKEQDTKKISQKRKSKRQNHYAATPATD